VFSVPQTLLKRYRLNGQYTTRKNGQVT